MFSSNTSQVSGDALFIEDVFNIGLYSASGGSETFSILGSVDMYTKGGLMWIKTRNAAASHSLIRPTLPSGGGLFCQSNTTAAQNSFSTTEFKVNSNNTVTMANGDINSGGSTYVSWNFAKSPKFFDVVTYTGDGNNARTIAHNLGSTPGFVIIKKTDSTGNWMCWHNSFASTDYIALNTTGAKNYAGSLTDIFQGVSSTTVTVGSNGVVNSSVNSYVMYVFASNAGGFGLTGTDNVISCGSFTSSSIGLATVDLGYEPQWILYKGSNGVTNWQMVDNMRGFVVGAANAGTSYLNANTSGAEATTPPVGITNTGFNFDGAANITYIYIAIRRGPMKVPTSGTSVFSPVAYTGNGTSQSITTGITGDLTYIKYRTDSGAATFWFDRLRNPKAYLESNSTAVEVTGTQHITAFNQLGFSVGNNGNVNDSGGTFISQTFQRAPSFFDEVCYTGNGSSNNAKTHNLGVAPELLIIKNRSSSASGDWYTFHTFTSSNFKKQLLDTTDAQTNYTYGSFLDAQPTSTTFTVNSGAGCNESGVTYVAYLFATCAGVSKVGSYTGTGTTKQIDCGFTGGARFVLIKRTDSTGDWYVWDTARGIVSGNDPYLLLNSTAAETTGTDYIDTYSAGFEISSTAPAAINASGGTFIFLAIA